MTPSDPSFDPHDPQSSSSSSSSSSRSSSSSSSSASRHSSHKTEIKEKLTPLGRHFAQCGIENFSLQIIDTVKEGEGDALEILEGF